MRVLRYFWQFLAVFLLFGPISASAQDAGVSMADHVQGRLIGTGEDVALELRLSPGWHTYWKAPGDAGLPPRFDWSASDNIEFFTPEYPLPERFDEMGLQVFGYKNEVTLPGKVGFTNPKAGAVLRLKADVMVCHEICIPQELNLEVQLSDQIVGAIQKRIEFARRRVPVSEDTPQLKIDTVVAGPEAVVINAHSNKGFDHADAFVIVDHDWVLTGKPEITVDESDKGKALIKIPTPDDLEINSTLVVTLTDGSKAVEKTIRF